MVDKEQVIGDLEEQIAWIRDNDFHKFPGWGHAVLAMRDALALLKAQQPRLLTLDEIHESMVVYLEAGTKFLGIVDDDGVVLAIGGSERTGAKCFITVWDVGVAAMNDEYNVTWRAWSERPTREQREGTAWECSGWPKVGCEFQVKDYNPDGTVNIVECAESEDE